MKITKYVHACLLVEMPAPVNQTVLFDPGIMSEQALNVDRLEYLDDIIITHLHPDHMSITLLNTLIAKFPQVRITAPADAVAQLAEQGITADSEPKQGFTFFDSPHEVVEPLFPTPQQLGVHFLDKLTHPGDGHSFMQTQPVLALPLAGPWASMVKAINLAISLKPQYVLPIHDWHLSDQAREQAYGNLQAVFKKENITFVALKTGEPVVLEV